MRCEKSDQHKYRGTKCLKVTIEVLFLKRNVDKTLEKRKHGRPTNFRFGSRLCKGNVLTPLTSVVLNGNFLISFVSV